MLSCMLSRQRSREGRVFILAGGKERVKQSETPRKNIFFKKKETCLAKGEREMT